MAPGAAMETAVCDGHLRFLNVLLQQHVRVLPEEYKKWILMETTSGKTYPYSAPCSGDKFPRQSELESRRR